MPPEEIVIRNSLALRRNQVLRKFQVACVIPRSFFNSKPKANHFSGEYVLPIFLPGVYIHRYSY